MRTIKNWDDIEYIWKHKLDVKDFRGYTIPYVRFASFTLSEILNNVFGVYTYDPKQ